MLEPAQSAKRFGLTLLVPAFVWLFVFMILPLTIIFVFSFGSRDLNGKIALGVNLGNYFRFFFGPYLACLYRSLWLASSTCLICLLVGGAAAMWLAFCVPKEKRNIYMTLLVAPLWTSFLLRMYAWITILRPTGLFVSMAKHLGILNPPHILFSPQAVLLGMVYNYLPYMILPLYAALEKLDLKLIEAASDLGAGPWTAFAKVTVPLSSRGIVAGVIMVFVPSLGDYVTPDLMGGAKTMFIGNLIQNQFLVVRDWAFGSAVSSILICLVAVAVWVYLKYGDSLQWQ